jgi:hypothetical protein
MDVRSGGGKVHGFLREFRDGSLTVRNVMTSVRDADIRACCEFSLKMTESTMVKRR